MENIGNVKVISLGILKRFPVVVFYNIRLFLPQLLDRVSDCMAFGALKPCPECKEGQLAYR